MFLLPCLTLAEKTLGECAPNPAVGCVIVKNNTIIAEGFHKGCGNFHAEVEALNQCDEDLSDAILYVSLEPCCHYGRTPPCTDKIIASGIKKVFFALYDPNPIVAGKGQLQLRAAGIACEHISLPAATYFYRAYSYWFQQKLPFVTAKLAVSLDGKIALKDKKPAVITGFECQQLTHQGRKHADAILTSIETILSDDPQLNVRLNNAVRAKNIYVVDTHAQLPLNAKIFNTAKSMTVFHGVNALREKIDLLRQHLVNCICIENSQSGLNLKMVLAYIARAGAHHLWIEAGDKLTSALLCEGFIHEFLLYVSNKRLGDDAYATLITEEKLREYFLQETKEILGEDKVCRFLRKF